MLAFSPPSFPTFGWPIEDPMINQEYNSLCAHTTHIPNQFLHFPDEPVPQVGNRDSYEPTVGDSTMTVKKINHNANERDRRKKMNSLYTSLRSLLPASDQVKKLSIPNTVSRVLKYIPELQKEVERLIRKREDLSLKISKKGELIQFENQRNNSIQSCLSTVSTSLLGDKDVTIQISTPKVNMSLLPNAIEILEKEAFHFVNASFNTFGDRSFYNLHCQVQRPDQVMEMEILRKKLSTLCEKREDRIHSTLISSQNI